jgi:hypothetical protein
MCIQHIYCPEQVYLDDGDSGWLVQDNYFGNAPMCVLMGGGRNNTVLRNYFDHCGLGIDIGERNDPGALLHIYGSICTLIFTY